MQLSVAATLLAQCVPSLSQKFIVQHLRSTNDNVVQELGAAPSTRRPYKFKTKANNRHAEKRWLSKFQGVLQNGFTQSSRGNHQCDPTSMDPDTGILSCGNGFSCRPNDASDIGGFCQSNGVTRQGLFEIQSRVHDVDDGYFTATYSSLVGETDASQRLQCDPNSADLGILSCQEGEVCRDDKTSDLGGICVQTAAISRNLYTLDDILQVCDPTTGSIYEKVCDCSGVNNATGSGTISCHQQDLSFGLVLPGCDDIMFDLPWTYLFDSGIFISLKMCYAITVPYYKKACFTGFYPIGVNKADSCSMEINDQECSSCAITDEFYDFDCSTIDPKLVGTTVFDLLPITAQCYTGATNSTVCTLCSEGYFIPEAKYDINVTVAEYGTMSCGAMAYAAAKNMISDKTYCSNLAAVAQNGCCEPSNIQGITDAPSPGSSDPIVPDGGESQAKPDGGEGSAAVRVISVCGVVWSVVVSTLSQFLAFS